MNKLCSGVTFVTACLLATTPVLAADASRFDGVYAGVFAGLGSVAYEGYVDGDEIEDDAPYHAEIFSGDFVNGLVGGGNIGVNVAHGDLIYGLEAGFTVGNIEAYAADEDGTDFATQTLSALFTLSGRLGYAVTEDTLVYGSGGAGLLVSNFHAYNDWDELDRDDGSATYSLPGIVVAAGVEQVIAEDLALKVEGSYFLPVGEKVFVDDELHHDMNDGDYGTSSGVFRLTAGLSFQF